VQFNRAGFELPFAEQLSLIFAQMLPVQSVGWSSEVLGEIFHRMNVVLDSRRSVISALPFLQHDFA
jgi:hypothetical protein